MEAERISNEDLLATDCEILVPAAVGGVLHAGNGGRVRARMVVEGANGPTTPEADRILAERGVLVVPDILANAGGVSVSHLEWTQNTQNVTWERAQVDAELSRRLVVAHDTVRGRRRPTVLAAPGRLPRRGDARRAGRPSARLRLR
jgi:glutamate dehydrogenase (NAD(P)+)